jgi:hypothetical protein
MAWRIHESVIRGELDNREKGRVTGRLWIEGVPEPVLLRLTGNAHPDLAGCRLEFHNTGEPAIMLPGEQLAPEQTGTAGDMTASRRVRVYDVPTDEAYLMGKRGEKPPEHMANCLYLEWFSTTNGRVVIESVDFQLEISAPEWRMTDSEEAERARTAAAGMSEFMNQLNDAVDAAESEVDYEKDEWDEFDYEKFMRESDAKTDKYIELIDKYGDSEEGERKIDEEMGWASAAEPEDSEAPFEIAEPEEIEELVPVPETEGKDWIRTADGHVAHPLQDRCFRNAMALWHECNDLDPDADERVSEFITGYQIIGAKLAGALNSLAYGHETEDGAFIVACLKRVIDILHKAQETFEQPAVQEQLPAATATRVRNELFELREAILNLMHEFRGPRG